MLLGAATAVAQTVAPVCDDGFWASLSVRAENEGRRELEVAQMLINKPDSVLEYSCFGENMNRFASNAVFSEDLPSAVGGLAGDASNTHVNSNFDHSLGGGLDAPEGGTCGAMAAVWEFMKCRNANINNFVTFASLASADFRTEPDVCTNAGARTTEWGVAVAAANPIPGGLGGPDVAFTYLNFLNPSSCSAHRPVPTGLIADIKGTAHEDAVCSAPSCSYNHTTGLCQ